MGRVYGEHGQGIFLQAFRRLLRSRRKFHRHFQQLASVSSSHGPWHHSDVSFLAKLRDRKSLLANGLSDAGLEISLSLRPRSGRVPCTSGQTSCSLIVKYSSNYVQGEAGVQQQVLYTGNSVKSMHVSVEASLKKLRTSYIDILYVHWWDWETSVEEVMNGLHMLVQQGMVLYLVRVVNILDVSDYVLTRSGL